MADDREFLREQVRRLNTVLSRYQKGENSGTLNETTDSVHSSLTPCLTHNKFMAPLLTEYDNIIHELEQQVAHYKNELENLSGRVKELVEENKQLHSELQCQSQLNKEKYKEVEGGVHTSDPLHLSSLTEQDSGTYVQLWKQTCAELEQLQQSDTRKTKELTECKSQLTYTQQALSSAEQRIMELKSQCQELSSQQKHCLQNAHTSEQEVTSTQQQLSKCRSELKATQLKNSDLKQQLDEVAAKLRNMESAASLCKDQEQNLDHKLHSVANTNTELEAKLKICHRECSVLREEKCELESKQTQLENEIETLLHRETKAAIEVKDSMDMLQKILLEKEQMEVQEQQHVLEIERLRKSISVLLEEAGVRTKKEVELVREECNKNIDKMASEIQKMEKQCGYRQGQLDQALREKKSLQCELERALSQVPLEQGRVRATLQDLRTKLSTAEKSHDEVMHKLRDVQFTNKTLQNQLSEEQEQCAELSAELQQMRTEWQSEGGQLREEVTRLTREQDRTLEQLTVMRKKLKATEQTYQHKITATLEEYQAREVVLQARLQATEEISSARVRELQDLVTSQQQRLMKWKEEARALKNMFEATVDKLKSENKLLVGRSRVMMSQLANQEEINNTLSESTLKMEDEVARLQTRLQDTETTADQATRQVAAMLSREKHILAQKRQLQEDIDRLRLQMTRATLPTTKSVFSRTVQNGLSSSTKLLDRPATTSWHPSSSFTGYKHSSS